MPFGPPGSLADIGPQILMAALQRQRQNPTGAMPNAPINPGAPPPAGSPAYVPGGQGPAMGTGGAPTGLLGMLMQRMGRGMQNAGRPMDPNSGLPVTQDVLQGAAQGMPLGPFGGGANGW